MKIHLKPNEKRVVKLPLCSPRTFVSVSTSGIPFFRKKVYLTLRAEDEIEGVDTAEVRLQECITSETFQTNDADTWAVLVNPYKDKELLVTVAVTSFPDSYPATTGI